MFPPVPGLLLPVGLLVAFLLVESVTVKHCGVVHFWFDFLICFFLLFVAVTTLCMHIFYHKTDLQ